MKKNQTIQNLAYLIHITHYDPKWIDEKDIEKPYDPALGLEIVDTLAESGFNMLIIDIEDGVEFKSHPELKRHYSVPMVWLKELADRARSKGLEVVPKLNFSKGLSDGTGDHNLWFRPYHKLPDNAKYWKIAFELIDELIGECSPERFFFIGMDEDTLRTDAQYLNAIKKLRDGLKKRKLRPVIWNDTMHLRSVVFECARKSLAAEDNATKDIVHAVWDYSPPKIKNVQHLREIRKKGFEVWFANGRNPEYAFNWQEEARKCGCKGMLMTVWAKASARNQQEFLDKIRKMGDVYTGKTSYKKNIEPEEKSSLRKLKTNKAIPETKEARGPVLAPNYLTLGSWKRDYLIKPEYYVRNWMVLGPFKFDRNKYRGDEHQEVIDDASFIGVPEEMLSAKKPGTKEYGMQWRKYSLPEGKMFPQVINLFKFYKGFDYSLAYLTADVYAPGELKDCILYLGSDDYIKVWINGELVHCYNQHTRCSEQDNDKVEGVCLKKGWNTVVVKCVNITETWDFMLRFATGKDKLIKTVISK